MASHPANKTARTLNKGTGKHRYLYRQLADFISEDIENGKLEPGDLLPSMDELAATYEINKATVRQAFSELIAAGMIYSIPAKGTFVTDRAASSDAPRKRRSLSVGWISSVCINGCTGRYHTEIMDAARDALQDIRGHLVVLSTSGIPVSSFCQLVGDADLDAAILMGPFQDEPIRQLVSERLPCVLVDDSYRGLHIDTILNDNRLAGYQAIEHLTSLGHTDLALITGGPDSQASIDRLGGAYEAMSDAGLDPEKAHVIDSDFSPEGGYMALLELLEKPPLPTGVFFFNDEMAFGAYRALYEHSPLRVPDDISFVGCDNVSWASMTHPPLTTVHVEKQLIGQEAVQRIAKILENQAHIPSKTIIPTRLEIRNSTSEPSNKRK